MTYHRALVEVPPGGLVLNYFHDRGLSNEAIQRFVLGVVNPVRGHERYAGMVSIPYRDALGNVTGLKFRNLGEGEKYLNPPGTRLTLYNIGDSGDPKVYVAEGEFDTIILAQMGLSAVGIPGVAHWRPHWRWLFRDSTEVVVILDRDDKGQGAERTKTILDDIGSVTDVREAVLPRGHDVNSLYLKDPEKLEGLL